MYHPVSLVHRRRAAVVACPTGCDRNRRQANVSVLPDTNQATAELMKLFYRNLLGPARLRPAEALRTAQNSLRRQPRWSDPYYWAGFTLQGEWR